MVGNCSVELRGGCGMDQPVEHGPKVFVPRIVPPVAKLRLLGIPIFGRFGMMQRFGDDLLALGIGPLGIHDSRPFSLGIFLPILTDISPTGQPPRLGVATASTKSLPIMK